MIANIAGWFGKALHKVFGSRNDREIQGMMSVVARIAGYEKTMRGLTDLELREKTPAFRKMLADGKTLDDILPEAFAACREVSCRAIGLRHFDVQLVGGMILHQGKIAEMVTGEGKTLVATLAAYLNGLTCKGVHLVTVNDYLARRDMEWMAPVYRGLGMTVGVIQSNMLSRQRVPAYACDITYGTNNEYGFDYLRDNMKVTLEEQCQKHHYFAIIDEVDSILIDEARTPLIISGPAEDYTAAYFDADRVARKLVPGDDFEIKEKEQQCLLSEAGIHKAEKLAGVETFYSGATMDWPHRLETALRARHLYKKDKDYVVNDGEVVIVDEFTGRMMTGRRWSDGLHQAVEAKEGLRVHEESQTLATITFQNFFRLYDKLSGMTGTALTEAGEFDKIYGLDVVAVPTNRPLIRQNYDDVIYITEREKYRAMVEEIAEVHGVGRPVLVGTTSIEKSERISEMLGRRGVKHEVLNAKHHAREASIVAEAGQQKAVTIATNMAGRGTDIVLGPGVKALGGLHIVGTERHESRRVDNQLRGRAGRQGDPGSSRFFLSLEDDLMRIFAGPMVKGLMGKLAEDGMDIQHPMVSRAIGRAQKRVEAHNFEIRKNLLEYDQVMDEQRKLIYSMRQKVLRGESSKDEILEWLKERMERELDGFLPDTVKPDKWDVDGLSEFMQTRFGLDIPAADIRGQCVGGVREFEDGLKEKLVAAYNEREGRLGEETMRHMERFLLLNAIDTRWKDHLYAMDVLRDSIGLEGMGGKDPKVEYKRKGYEYFDEMLEGIKDELTDLIFKLEYQEEDAQRLGQVWGSQDARHDAAGAYSANRSALDGAVNADQGDTLPEPIKRRGRKIGRNDPCYCGSGKKYKKCHGAD